MNHVVLEDVISALESEMCSMDPADEAYHQAARSLKALYEALDARDRNQTSLHAKEIETRSSWREAVLGGLTSAGSILAILHFEKIGVVTSKAFGLVKMLVR